MAGGPKGSREGSEVRSDGRRLIKWTATSCRIYMGYSSSSSSGRTGKDVARTSPGEFINQVKAETKKVVWPSRKETVTTTIMVGIMTTLLALFFFGIDQLFAALVKFLLSLVG